MQDVADRVRAMRRQLVSRVREALDDAAPEIAESAIGRLAQAGALVALANELLSEQVGRELASRLVTDLAQRPDSAA